jgi:hypothetical protein
MTPTMPQNKTLSDDSDDILKLQGLSWFKRRAISMFTLTLGVKHYTDEAGNEHIDVEQTLSGGIKGSNEDRILDWEARGEVDDIFGAVIGKSKKVKAEEVEDEFLKSGWTEDTFEDGLVLAIDWSDTAKSGMDWRAEMVRLYSFLSLVVPHILQTWGFEVLNGERRHARRLKFTSSNKKDGPIFKHLYYDYSESLLAVIYTLMTTFF